MNPTYEKMLDWIISWLITLARIANIGRYGNGAIPPYGKSPVLLLACDSSSKPGQLGVELRPTDSFLTAAKSIEAKEYEKTP